MDGILRIIGSHDHGDGNPEIVKTECPAVCTTEGNISVITYNEELRGDASSSPIQHRLEIGVGTLRMSQTGALESDMRFGPGKEWHSSYRTPYGEMDMSVTTKSLMIETGTKKISAHVQYSLSLDGNMISDSKVRITFIPKL